MQRSNPLGEVEMGSGDKREEYLRRADDADTRAKQARSASAQQEWRHIATEYRDLAKMAHKPTKAPPPI